MTNIIIAFENISGVTLDQMRTGNIKPRYKYLSTHMLFYIKMDRKLISKDYLVDNGHKADAPDSITYLRVVSRDIVRISFLISPLNFLGICACDTGNA